MKRSTKILLYIACLLLTAMIPVILIAGGVVPTEVALKLSAILPFLWFLFRVIYCYRSGESFTNWMDQAEINWDYDPEHPKEDEK